MDRQKVLRGLKAAEEHLREVDRTVQRHEEITAALASGGHDLTYANEVLRLYKRRQAKLRAEQDRLRAELSILDRSTTGHKALVASDMYGRDHHPVRPTK
jgi:hypothetical protein